MLLKLLRRDADAELLLPIGAAGGSAVGRRPTDIRGAARDALRWGCCAASSLLVAGLLSLLPPVPAQRALCPRKPPCAVPDAAAGRCLPLGAETDGLSESGVVLAVRLFSACSRRLSLCGSWVVSVGALRCVDTLSCRFAKVRCVVESLSCSSCIWALRAVLAA